MALGQKAPRPRLQWALQLRDVICAYCLRDVICAYCQIGVRLDTVISVRQARVKARRMRVSQREVFLVFEPHLVFLG